MSELPKGWIQVRLGDVLPNHDSRRIPVNAAERAARPGEFPYYGANGQVGTIDSYLFDGDFILVAEDGGYFDQPERGVAYRATGRFWVNNHAHILSAPAEWPVSFFVAQLNTVPWMNFVGGSTRLKLTQAAMVEIPLRLPPLNEQKRIVEKLESLQARSRRAKAALDEVPALLEKLRQSILAAAFRGDLTKEWREKSPNVEPASALLARIRVERRKKWEEAELAKMTAKGKKPTDDKWKAKYKEPEPVDTTELPELPEGWCWASVNDLIGSEDDLFDGPFGSSLKSTDYVEAGVRVIRLENIANILFRDERSTFISLEKFDTLQKHQVREGDIIFGSFVEETTRVCVLPHLDTKAIAKADCFCVRPCPAFVEARYLELVLGSPHARNQLTRGIHGATRPRINTGQLRRLPIPLAPAGERLAILDAVSSTWARLSDVGMAAPRMALDSLDRSLLAKAFRGELVPQDPNDEPADVMLARVKAAAGDVAPKGRGRPARTAVATETSDAGEPAAPKKRGRPKKA